MELNQAKAIANEIVIRLSPYCSRIEVAGSIRRPIPALRAMSMPNVKQSRAMWPGIDEAKVANRNPLVRCEGQSWASAQRTSGGPPMPHRPARKPLVLNANAPQAQCSDSTGRMRTDWSPTARQTTAPTTSLTSLIVRAVSFFSASRPNTATAVRTAAAPKAGRHGMWVRSRHDPISVWARDDMIVIAIALGRG